MVGCSILRLLCYNEPMKVLDGRKLVYSFCAATAVLALIGCSTTKKVDWNSRIGICTFDQAVQEMGPPDKQAKTSDGRTVADWISHTSGGSSFSLGTGF